MLGPREGLDPSNSKLAESQIVGVHPFWRENANCVGSRAFTKPHCRRDLKLGIPLTKERGELET